MMAPFRYSQASRGVVFYYHNDHLNTPVKMSDEKGNIVWEVVSKHPFGSFEVSSKEVVLSDYTGNSNDSFSYKIENPIRFPGQYDDSDTKDVRSIILNNAEGLYYNYHRWYNPDIGRYMEVVNIAFCSSEGSYVYAENNSINYADIEALYVISRNCNKKIIRDAVNKAIDGIKNCTYLSDSEKNNLIYSINNSYYACASCNYCGQVPYNGTIIICKNNIELPSKCGCPEAILAHEGVHNIIGPDECLAYKVEKLCFSCSGEIPPCYKEKCNL